MSSSENSSSSHSSNSFEHDGESSSLDLNGGVSASDRIVGTRVKSKGASEWLQPFGKENTEKLEARLRAKGWIIEHKEHPHDTPKINLASTSNKSGSTSVVLPPDSMRVASALIHAGPPSTCVNCLTLEEINKLRCEYSIPGEYVIDVPAETGRIIEDHGKNKMWVYRDSLVAGLRFPLHPFILELLNHYRLALHQLVPGSWRSIVGFITLCRALSHPALLNVFRKFFSIKKSPYDQVIPCEWEMSNAQGVSSARGKIKDMADKNSKDGKSGKNKFNVFYYIKLGSKGGSSVVEAGLPLDKGKKASKRKAAGNDGTVEASPKRPCSSELGTSQAVLVDKEKLNAPCYVNSSASVHHAYLALMHALKAEQQARAKTKKASDFQKQNFQLKERVRKLKNAEAEVKDLRAEVVSLNKKLAEAEAKKEKAVQEALANFQSTPEFEAAAKEANEEAVIGTFELCLDEVRYVYPNLDLSMVSLKNLKTAHTEGVEEDTITLAAETNAVTPVAGDGTEVDGDGIRGDATS
ncbi:Transposase (putative), gypsy type [Corchorus capsularis]|uniref:Transposase (Putative), gypsy type n=1 Tax=Corchorus capsularis TaxID=210143 RepID=A0A1R3GVH3_COCAP|nr:Transposase (putative), gypsy type [Corchorus capsularis]